MVVLDDFEDGDVTEWSTGGAGTFSATTQFAFEGSYSMVFDAGVDRSITQDTYPSLSGYYRTETYPGNTYAVMSWRNTSSSTYGPRFHIAPDGSVETGPYNSRTDTGYDIPQGKWAKLRAYNIDYSAQTYDVEIIENGSVAATVSGISMAASSGMDLIEVGPAGGDAWTDFLASGGTTIGATVSGTVTDPAANGIDGATLDLLDDTDTAIASTTSKSDGTYSFSGVADATDYQVRATAPGYSTETTASFDVSGSDVNGRDLSLSLAVTLSQTNTSYSGGGIGARFTDAGGQLDTLEICGDADS